MSMTQRLRNTLRHKVNSLIAVEKKSTTTFRKLTLTDTGERGHWDSEAEFVLSCVGLSVGLGNLWRFPTLAYDNGGAAFFIPYIILQVFIGKPVYFMELCLGQYCGAGPTGVFKCNPLGRGVGLSMIVISFFIAVYYNAIMAICLYYMFASMQSHLPWTECLPGWIYHHCYSKVGESMPLCGSNATSSKYTSDCKCTGNKSIDFNITQYPTYLNFTYDKLRDIAQDKTRNISSLMVCTENIYPPAHFYFYDRVVQQTGYDLRIGFPIWYLCLCLLLSSTIVIICLLRGIRTSGKVVYFTATFPYVVILILLIRTALREGAVDGIKLFLLPKWEQLQDFEVWLNAGGQMFFSLSIGMGAIITLGSYNRIHDDVYRDAMIIATADLVTSFLAGLVVFMTLGAMANETGQKIEKVASKGFGLVFIAYPEALSHLPAPQLWSILFFFMLFTLGIDTEFALTETILTALVDEVPRILKDKMVVTIVGGIIMYIIAMIFVTPGGLYVVQIIDQYGASYPLYIVCCAEAVAVTWIYGYKRFLGDVHYMLGYRPHPQWFWVVCWTFVVPVFTLGMMLTWLWRHKPLVYTFWAGPGIEQEEPYEIGAQVACWVVMIISLLPMPVVAISTVVKSPGETIVEKIRFAATPLSTWMPQKENSTLQTEKK